jgi:tetratricopeptide (TPR) repeat protein
MHPQDIFTAGWYGVVLALNERFDEAYEVIDACADQLPDHPFVKSLVILKYALQGNKELAMQVVTPELRAALRWDEQVSWLMARSYALLDDRQEALAWLEHATLDRGFINYPLLAKFDPALENLRGDARFDDLMEQVKVRWERFEV